VSALTSKVSGMVESMTNFIEGTATSAATVSQLSSSLPVSSQGGGGAITPTPAAMLASALSQFDANGNMLGGTAAASSIATLTPVAGTLAGATPLNQGILATGS
jgi:hypothetical protein